MKQIKCFFIKISVTALLAILTFGILVLLTALDDGKGIFSKITKSDGISINEFSIKRLEDASKETNYTKLIVGDSVANGIFSELQEINDVYYIGTMSRGATMKGYFCELQLFQRSHPHMTDVYIIIRPQTMRAIFNTKDSYTTILLPLYKTNNLAFLNSHDMAELNKLFGSTFINGIGAKINSSSALARKIYLNILYSHNEMGVEVPECFSDLTIRTLLEMERFCDENDINMHFISAPLILENGEYDFMKGDETADTYQIQDIWNQMKKSITYYPKESFSDGYHLSKEYLNQNRKNVIKNIIEKSGELKDLIY